MLPVINVMGKRIHLINGRLIVGAISGGAFPYVERILSTPSVLLLEKK